MVLFADNSTIRILNSFCDVSMNEFDNRLKLQKIAFLAQKLGAVGGFTFSWYKRGPYSPSLTQALFQCEQVGQLGKKQQLKPHEEKIIEQIIKLTGKNGVDDPKILELHASVWYLIPDWQDPPNIEHVISVMSSEKPAYSQAEVSQAISNVLKFRKTAAA